MNGKLDHFSVKLPGPPELVTLVTIGVVSFSLCSISASAIARSAICCSRLAPTAKLRDA
jgi:hypothetical protein